MSDTWGTVYQMERDRALGNDRDSLLAEIERLRLNNASLVEVLRDKPCPYDGRYTIGECQQCGCSEGLFAGKRDLTQTEAGR
jgi:hypothetical protein